MKRIFSLTDFYKCRRFCAFRNQNPPYRPLIKLSLFHMNVCHICWFAHFARISTKRSVSRIDRVKRSVGGQFFRLQACLTDRFAQHRIIVNSQHCCWKFLPFIWKFCYIIYYSRLAFTFSYKTIFWCLLVL